MSEQTPDEQAQPQQEHVAPTPPPAPVEQRVPAEQFEASTPDPVTAERDEQDQEAAEAAAASQEGEQEPANVGQQGMMEQGGLDPSQPFRQSAPPASAQSGTPIAAEREAAEREAEDDSADE